MSQIAYLIGAGASANVLPTIKLKSSDTNQSHFSAWLRSFVDRLANDDAISSKHSEFVKQLCIDLDWIAESTDLFTTPDTFAKYLFLKQRNELPRLKSALSAFFTIEQISMKKRDHRVLPFLTSIMNEGHKVPGNISFLTWNYDFQLQLAAHEFFKEESISRNKDSNGYVHTPPLIPYFPHLGLEMELDRVKNNDFQLYHLNGIAGFYRKNFRGFNQVKNLFEKLSETNLNSVIAGCHELYKENSSYFNFAFEETDLSKAMMDGIKLKVQNTEILVVIGYSFPFFNRKYDFEIIEAMRSQGSLKKIYIQDPAEINLGNIRSQFSIGRGVDIEHIKSKDNYFIPREL